MMRSNERSEPSLGNSTELGSAEEFAAKYSYTALRFYMLAIARKLLPNHRVQICWRYPLPERKTIDLIYSDERERARAVGTMKCGLSWLCPVCSQYIAERRREELGRALEQTRERYITLMLTYTAQHDPSMRLKTLLDGMQKAFRYVKTGRAWSEIKEEFHLVGSVRATEITYGASGWHPHYHELMFVDVNLIRDVYEGSISEYAEGLEAVMVKRWIAGLAREQLSGNEEIALRATTTDKDAAEYIAKYGKMPLETNFKSKTDEVSRATTKRARGGNLSVWDILFNADADKKYERLFLEYSHTVKGRSQLQWSRGLKDLLQIEEISDQIACEGVETETDRILAKVPVELWRYIAEVNYLSQLMTYAHTGDAEKVSGLLSRIESEYNARTWVIPQIDIGL